MIIQGNTRTFEPVPEGLHNAVLVDVVDLGEVTTRFGTRPMVRFVWETEQRRDDGSPFLVFKRYTHSLHEKANLFKDLRSWKIVDLQPAAIENGIDSDSMLGASCQLLVQHSENDGKTYANVMAVAPAQKHLEISGSYERKEPDEAKA